MTQASLDKKEPGRPRISKAGVCIRDGYTCPVELRDRFSQRCRELGLNKSEVIRGWIEWFLEEGEESATTTAANSSR